MARYDDLNTTAIAYTTFISCVILLIIIFVVQALCFGWLEHHEQLKVANESFTASDEIIAAQRKSLEGYRWVKVPAPLAPGQKPPEAGQPVPMIEKLQIPLERATELLLKEANAATAPQS